MLWYVCFGGLARVVMKLDSGGCFVSSWAMKGVFLYVSCIPWPNPVYLWVYNTMTVQAGLLLLMCVADLLLAPVGHPWQGAGRKHLFKPFSPWYLEFRFAKRLHAVLALLQHFVWLG